MDLRRIAGGFLAALGGLMIGVWLILFAMGQVPEAQTAPIRLAFLLVAEMATAVVAVVSGVGLVMRRSWACRAYLVASGMMVYSITNYLGVLSETGPAPVVVLFLAFLAVTIYFLLETTNPRRGGLADGRATARSSS